MRVELPFGDDSTEANIAEISSRLKECIVYLVGVAERDLSQIQDTLTLYGIEF